MNTNEERFNIEQQYNEQYREIKRKYRKRKLIKIIILAMMAIPSIAYFYMAMKGLVEENSMLEVITFVLGAGATITAIRIPFYQTHSEYIELRDLNSAYTHERFRERKG